MFQLTEEENDRLRLVALIALCDIKPTVYGFLAALAREDADYHFHGGFDVLPHYGPLYRAHNNGIAAADTRREEREQEQQ